MLDMLDGLFMVSLKKHDTYFCCEESHRYWLKVQVHWDHDMAKINCERFTPDAEVVYIKDWHTVR